MPEDTLQPFIPADAEARCAIVTELDINMMVEAGAGSGKTTALVGRMLALIAKGEPVENIAAITFTRKAANELRERFQEALEHRLTHPSDGQEVAAFYKKAILQMDRVFIGTTHAFCARLLREHALDAGLDPNFAEVTGADWTNLTTAFWYRWTDRLHHANDPSIRELETLGIQANDLLAAFRIVSRNSDVTFITPEVTEPDASACRRALDALLQKAEAMMPSETPPDGWDKLMRTVRRLKSRRANNNWSCVSKFCRDMMAVTEKQCVVTQKLWSTTAEGKKSAKMLELEFVDFCNGILAETLKAWREHCYASVMHYLQRATRAFANERKNTGQFGFDDLLLLTSQMLQDHADVREQAGRRYRRLLVDEFQDTDPLQAEICFLLASNPTDGTNWHQVKARPGNLFLVGDPKQSIYRFRRADIQVYEAAKARIARYGRVISLTHNFRSVDSIASGVNSYFESRFPAIATETQAAFHPMHTAAPPKAHHGVYRYTIEVGARGSGLLRLDAEHIASWIAQRIESGERTAADFLILTATKPPITTYAKALAARNIPVTTSGATLTREMELRELCLVLKALADPENPVLVAAALEGLFVGCSPADLYTAHLTGTQFGFTRPPGNSTSLVDRGLQQLHNWWQLSQQQPPDILIDHILNETGLLYLAASQSLGDARAGALLHIVEAVRGASTNRPPGLSAAIKQIEALFLEEADDTPLRPGRSDAVRVMNLHKVKGLQANVVILAAPSDRDIHEPTRHVTRDTETGTSVGMLTIADNKGNTIAQPPKWNLAADRERAFLQSEDERLLYVAVTRAREELVISRCLLRYANQSFRYDTSRWSPLHQALDNIARDIDLPLIPALGRQIVDTTFADIESCISYVTDTRKKASRSSFTTKTVTASIKKVSDDVAIASIDGDEVTDGEPSTGGRGSHWGNAVHRCIDALGKGRTGESLRGFMTAVAADEGLTGEEHILLQSVLDNLQETATWKELSKAQRLAVELPIMLASVDGDHTTITEGIIDAIMETPTGWTVVDWKTDAVNETIWQHRIQKYQQQVDRYANMFSKITNAPVIARIERIV